MSRVPLALVFDDRGTGRIAFAVLAGALTTDPATAAVPIEFVGAGRELSEVVRDRLEEADRVLVGWSFFSGEFAAAVERLHAFRSRIADARVRHIAGGVHASADPAGTLRAGFDLVAVGEAERTIVSLVSALLSGAAVEGVRGLATQDPTGKLRPFERGEAIDLDDWPPFSPTHRRLGPIEITRGCRYACQFCQTPFLYKARFRHRTLRNVCDWVRVCRDRNLRDYRFLSPTSLSYGSEDAEPRLDRVEELLAGVREIIGPERRLFFGTFPSEVRPEHVTARALAILRRYADNNNLIIGGQSGSEAVLARSRRGHGVAVIEPAVRLARDAGFVPHVDFIFGLPGETEEDVQASIRLMERVVALGAKVHGHTFLPLPGTPFQHETPVPLSPHARLAIERLASRGLLYGQWRRQEAGARELAERQRCAR